MMVKQKRPLGLVALLFMSVGGILGSGWLFAPLYAAQLAGPASLVSWLVGGVAIGIVAITFAEVVTLFPLNGGITRYATISYGRTVGFVVSVCTWLTFTVIVAAEVQAVLQYISVYLPWLTSARADGSEVLTVYGFFAAAGIWLLLSFINWLGIEVFARANTWLTWVKIGLVITTTVALFSLGFKWEIFNDVEEGGFSPSGSSGVFRALAYGGVVYAFAGFQHAAIAAGDSARPHRDVPFAVIGSIFITLALYLGLQVAFLGVLGPEYVAHGWGKLHFVGEVGPLAGLARTLGAVWLFWVVFVGAVVGPLGAGLVDLASSVRVVQCMSEDEFLPARLQRVGRHQTPGLVILLSFPIGLFLFMPFPGWQELVAFLASVIVIPYTMGPLCLMALRDQMPTKARPFELRFAQGICPLAFVVCGLLLYWAGWQIVWKLGVVFLISCGGFIVQQGLQRKALDLQSALWTIPYLGGISLLTLFGGHGGVAWLPEGWTLLAVAFWCLISYAIALPLALSPSKAHEYARQLHEAFADEDSSSHRRSHGTE